MKLEFYSISPPVKGLTKSFVIWIREESTIYPLVYLQKPKWISDKSFKKIVLSIRLDLPQDFEISNATERMENDD